MSFISVRVLFWPPIVYSGRAMKASPHRPESAPAGDVTKLLVAASAMFGIGCVLGWVVFG